MGKNITVCIYRIIIGREITMKKKYILILGLTVIILIWTIHSRFIFVREISVSSTIGVIDGSISKSYKEVVVFESFVDNSIHQQTDHGDNMIDFAKKINPKIKMYYYNATNGDNKITSEAIIEGLEWFKKNNVRTVNMSLSSTLYSPELDQYLQLNKDNFDFFASYNNRKSSFDYPAMYEPVVGVGVDDVVVKKEKDVLYHTNEIILPSNDFQSFKGNSFLSLYQAIKHSNQNQMNGIK